MLRSVSVKTSVGFLAVSVMVSIAFAQQAPVGGGARPAPTAAPLAFKVEWVRPASQEDTKVRYTPVQENVKDPNVEIKYYGAAAKQILTTGAPGSDVTPYGVWTGAAASFLLNRTLTEYH